nr:MAG TPA: endosialidase chaperone [Caudoviricetes sp.]
MKAESLYIQKLTYDENTGNEIIGLFPSEANPAIVSSYTYDAKRMGGAPTLTATIYSSEPLQWKKEEFVEYNGDRFFASYTPNSTKDNSSRMWKSEITFTSRRELLDNTLFFDVVVDDVDTQNKDRYRSNQTKFTFGGTIYEFVARINSSMAYCGLYRPTDEHKGYYVVIDEGYGTDEVKEVSFEDQYLTDVLQLINTTFELDYYWDGSVCHVGKVQHDLTDTPIKYGSSDALISVSKENANYKIVDMITGYGSSDNLPYYYPNDDEFGEAIFDAKNIASEHVDVTLSDYLRYSKYNDNLVLFKSKKGKYEGNVDVSTLYVRDTYSPENLTQADNSQNPKVKCWFWVSIKINVKKGQIIDFSKISFNFELFDYIQKKENITNLSSATRTINIYTTYHDLYKNVCTDSNLGDACSVEFAEDGTFYIDIDAIFSYNCKVFTMDGKRTFHGSSAWKVSFSGDVVFSLDTNSEYSWKNGDNYIPLDNSGIYVNGIASAKYVEYDYNFRKNDEGIYGFDKIYTGTEDDAVQVSVTGRKWIAPSSVLMPSIYRNTKGAERFYYALNNTHKLPSGSGYYEFVNLYKKGNPHQGTVTFGDIKPTIKGIVNAEGQLFGEIADIAFDSADSDVKDSDGKHIHNYFYIKLHKFNGDFGFDLFAHALASESAKINLIKSNGCPACSFTIGCYWNSEKNKCYNNVLTDGNGNLKSDSGKMNSKGDYILNDTYVEDNKSNQDSTKEELWICVQKDTSTLGIVMPNASAGFKPQKGDLFVITGIKPPKVLVMAAEKRLDDALVKHMSENNTDQFNYSVKFSRIFLQENPDFASKLNENAKLSIQIQGDSDSDGNLISHEVFVSNYSVKVDNDELAEVEIELVNSLEVTKSDTKQIIDAVKGETVKSLSSMVGGSNTNSFNASITDKMYLSKLKDDTAKGTVTWEKVQKFLQGLLVGGGSWTPDAEGRSHLITDYLEVRMKAIFEELVINKTSTIGGKEIISPAGGVVAHKVEEVTVTYNNVSQKAYRCYFLAEQEGDEVDNDFAVNDQVRSESFNVRKGTYHKAGNHFYWRLVIGRDEDPVELEEKKYHYIDLSDTDCATASDVPAKGDVLNQCGNRTDVERQNCLIFSSVDTYSPSISLYHGINSYSFANREYVEYGVNKQTNKAFFNVYGDMYVGDRPTKENGYEGSSYIRYDSSTKQVSVKGKISAKSTVDGKELSQYFKKIADLQNQVDGAIETWFYDGVPTLENAPAISWKTDKDKEIHLGDLYYDNKTGKAYRFAKDSDTYKWAIITDTDIAKALSDASKAQETANGKMKVFATQPTPPYQLGDIWVNATYPSDGSTYKNEVLRCQTDKKAGSQFAIADWIKASKYTDDTVANAAKKAAEEAKKAAETAQTNITNLGKTVTTNKKSFDNYVKDGYLEPSEIAAMAQDSKRLEDDFAAAEKSYNEVKGAEVLKSTKELTDLNAAFTTLNTAKTELITYLSDISARYNATDSDGKKAIYSRVATLYNNFQTAYDTFYNKLGLASAYITSTIIGKLNAVIGDVASYNYLKGALSKNASTDINGGLILSSLIALRDPDTGYVESGINGVVDNKAKGNGIATWWGGYMNDGQVVGFDKKNDVTKQAATSLIRFDGSGYLANGAIYWSVDGKVHADPTSFIISEKNLGAYLAFFEPTWKSGSNGSNIKDLVSLTPQAPFAKLDVSNDLLVEGKLKIGNITLSVVNGALKIDGNVFATGGISAYGESSGAGGGGGLNASVISYARIIEGSYTDADLTSIPNAYAIKALSSRIDNIATELGGLNLSWNNITGKPSTFTPSAHTHKWADITDRITKVSQLTNDAGYLTTHQSLDGYVNAIAVSGSGNAVTAVTKSGKTITFTKGATFLTSHQDISGKSDKTHTHSVKINGVTKTIAATGGTAVDLGTYLTSHQSLAAYLKSADAEKTYSKLGHTHAFSEITGKPTTLSGFGITDGLRSVTQPSGNNVFVTGISTSGTAVTYTKSYTKKSLSVVGTSGWTNASIDGNIIPDMSFIAYWNGAYSGTSSNLAYCNKGAFGSFAIKNSLAFSELTSKPTTISGYGITDAYTKSQVDAIAAKYLLLTGGTLTGQLKIVASALNGAYNGLLIGDDCYIGDCNLGNTIGLMGVANNNAGMVKFGKGGMQFGYNGSNHIASTTAQWTNLNADLLDGWHKDNIVWSGAVNSNTANLSHYWAKLFDITVTNNQYDDRSFTFLFSNGYNDTYSVVVLRIRQNGAKDSGAYNFSISLRELVGNMSSRLRVYYNNATGNVQLWGNCQKQHGSLSYTIIKKTGRASADFTSQGTLVTNTSFSAAQSLPATTGDSHYTLLDGATRIGIVKQADQLVTTRSIWGQSFNGTANVSGALSGATTISASNTISTTLQNGALKIGNKLTPISAIDAQVIFNTGAAVRFGETAWDWNQWAGLKYNHSNKTIYLGIADGSAFNANTPQLDGTLRLAGIKTITPNSGARIGGNGSLYLGDANNSGWVYVQDMCSQVNSSYWNIRQLGDATFRSLTVNDVITCDSIIVSKNTVINGSLSVAGLINNKGILPTNYEVNNKGAGCYVSADELCSGITAITDSIPVDNLSIVYSNDNGTNWTNYNVSNDTKFKAYANVAGVDALSLGGNVITGNTDAEKLAQIKKNQLMFTFDVPNNCYSQVYFACVDMGQGVGVTCTVEYLNSKGVIVNTYIKYMTGWNQFNYINLSDGNTALGVGNNDRRYIRFRFKHDQNTTALRNASINKIRIFAFTKYSFPTDRFMGHTGHIYNFDYNMNTYFPNSILAKGGVTAYQSSDVRLKTNITKLNCLNVIKSIGGTYEFDYLRDHKHSIGFIAQHVNNPLLKDIIAKDKDGYLKINYWSPKLISLAFGALTEIDNEVDKLKARVRELETEVECLKNKDYVSYK